MNVQTLAEMMNVKAEDVQMLLNSIVNSIKEDKVDEYFVNATESEQQELTEAYMVHAVRKFQSFVVDYMTNQDKKQSFNEYMYELLNAQ